MCAYLIEGEVASTLLKLLVWTQDSSRFFKEALCEGGGQFP